MVHPDYDHRGKRRIVKNDARQRRPCFDGAVNASSRQVQSPLNKAICLKSENINKNQTCCTQPTLSSTSRCFSLEDSSADGTAKPLFARWQSGSVGKSEDKTLFGSINGNESIATPILKKFGNRSSRSISHCSTLCSSSNSSRPPRNKGIVDKTVGVLNSALDCTHLMDYGNTVNSEASYVTFDSIYDEAETIERFGTFDSGSIETSSTCSSSDASPTSEQKEKLLWDHPDLTLTRSAAFSRRQQLKRKPRRPPRQVTFNYPLVSSLKQIPRLDPSEVPKLFYSENELEESRRVLRAPSTKRWNGVNCHSTRDETKESVQTSAKVNREQQILSEQNERSMPESTGKHSKITRYLQCIGPRKRFRERSKRVLVDLPRPEEEEEEDDDDDYYDDYNDYYDDDYEEISEGEEEVDDENDANDDKEETAREILL